jgi:hypothetical protein
MATETSGAAPVMILHRDLSTQNQIGSLLAIAEKMSDLLLNPAREAENIPGLRPAPGEARVAAEATFIKVCSQLESIIDDKQRWGIEYQLALEKMLTEGHELTQKMLRAQTAALEAEKQRAVAHRAAAEEIESPHARYRPTLYPVDGGWLALVGDPNDLENGIGGIGESPEGALKSFDATFRGKPSHQWQKLLENTKTKQDDNTKENVDGRGIQQGGGLALPGEKLERDSPGSGPEC